MNPTQHQPITRRDVVALFAYVYLIARALSALLMGLTLFVLPHFPPFSSSVSVKMGDLFPTHIVTATVHLLLLPLVPIVASGVAGLTAREAMTARGVRSLLLPCAGILWMAQVLPVLPHTIYLYFALTVGTGKAALLQPVYKTGIVTSLIQMSLGFALAFFPAIFDSMRHRVQNEESAT